MKRNAHPSNFCGLPTPCLRATASHAGGEWGMLTDGPADRDDLRAALTNHFDTKPDLDQVKVWVFQDDAAPREVTEGRASTPTSRMMATTSSTTGSAAARSMPIRRQRNDRPHQPHQTRRADGAHSVAGSRLTPDISASCVPAYRLALDE